MKCACLLNQNLTTARNLVFIYFWLCWVFIAAGFSLVVASRGCSLLWCAGFSWWERHVILREIAEMPRLQRFMQTVSEHARLDHALSMNLNLALEEAVSNVLLYAYQNGAGGAVSVGAVVWKDRIDFTVTDSGIPFDPTLIPDPDLSADVKDRPVGGLGIYLVRRIMDQVTYARRDGQNILSMTKKR